MADYWPQIITGVTGVAGTLLGGAITAWTQARRAALDRRLERASLARLWPFRLNSIGPWSSGRESCCLLVTLTGFADLLENSLAKSDRRTAARASLKVIVRFSYQTARRAGRAGEHRRVGPEGHEREQTEQGRRGARNGLVRPLTLRLHAEMPAHFRKGHLRRPATDEPAQDIERLGVKVRAQECLRPKHPGNIAHQNVADRHVLARMMPDCRIRDDLDQAFASAIPAIDADALPWRLGSAGLVNVGRRSPRSAAGRSCQVSRRRGANRRASRRKRVIMQTRSRTALSNSMAA